MPDDIRVSILDALAECHPSFDAKRTLNILAVTICIINITCYGILVTYTDGWSLKSLNIFSGHDPNRFYDKTMDVFVLTILQTILLPIVSWIAIAAGRENSAEYTREPITCCCFRCCYQPDKKYSSLSSKEGSFESKRNSEGNQPLLDLTELREELEGYEHEVDRLKHDNRALDEDALHLKKLLEARKGAWLGVMFFFSTVSQVYIGLKCISFKYTNEAREGALMGLGVLWVNLLTWTLRELTFKATSEDGELIPSLHAHRLHLHISLASHWCDLCGQPCKEGRAFRCKLCDFDLCMICYAKRDTFTLEGQLRGDKGVRQEETLTGRLYFMRAMSLILSEWKIFSVAVLSLIAYDGINLWIPTLQVCIEEESLSRRSYLHVVD